MILEEVRRAVNMAQEARDIAQQNTAKLDALKASFQACFKNDDATTRSAGPSEVLSDRCSANNFSTALAEVMNGLQEQQQLLSTPTLEGITGEPAFLVGPPRLELVPSPRATEILQESARTILSNSRVSARDNRSSHDDSLQDAAQAILSNARASARAKGSSLNWSTYEDGEHDILRLVRSERVKDDDSLNSGSARLGKPFRSIQFSS